MEKYFIDQNGGAVTESDLRHEWLDWLRQNYLSVEDMPFEGFLGNCMESAGGTLREVESVRLDKEAAMAILDRVEYFRRHHQNDRNYPADYCMRAIAAIVAEAAGYDNRMAWTAELNGTKNSLYAADMRDNGRSYNW